MSNTRLKALEARALKVQRAGGSWKPVVAYLHHDREHGVRVCVEHWDGMPESCRADRLAARGVERWRTLYAPDIESAEAAVKEYCKAFQLAHGLSKRPQPEIVNCYADYSDEGRRRTWAQQGGTTLEALADQRGVPLLGILGEYHQRREDWEDVLRWRHEIE